MLNFMYNFNFFFNLLFICVVRIISIMFNNLILFFFLFILLCKGIYNFFKNSYCITFFCCIYFRFIDINRLFSLSFLIAYFSSKFLKFKHPYHLVSHSP